MADRDLAMALSVERQTGLVGSMCKGPREVNLAYLQDRNPTGVARHRALRAWLKIRGLVL